MAKRPKLPAEALDFFRKEGAKGGKVRAKNLSAAQRSEGARKAVKARWAKAKREQ